ncbi:MAG TPA: hypothetical protein VFV90_02120 [Usitatibacter sp.]|nr:hypothetical protein [Usitatibacter sp.]
MLNRKLHLLVASIVFSGLAMADDYASPAVFIPVSADGNGHEEANAEPMSCKEARETAWFIRELSRTDGNTNPEVEYVPCARELLAVSTADYD